MRMSKGDARNVGSHVWEVNSFQRQLVGHMVEYVSFYLTNWLGICEITGQIVANNWNIINCYNELWLLLKRFDELEWHSFVP